MGNFCYKSFCGCFLFLMFFSRLKWHVSLLWIKRPIAIWLNDYSSCQEHAGGFFVFQSGIAENLQICKIICCRAVKQSRNHTHRNIVQHNLFYLHYQSNGCSLFRSANGKLSYVRYVMLDYLCNFQMLQCRGISLSMLKVWVLLLLIV